MAMANQHVHAPRYLPSFGQHVLSLGIRVDLGRQTRLVALCRTLFDHGNSSSHDSPSFDALFIRRSPRSIRSNLCLTSARSHFAPSNIFETLLLIGLYPITIEISTLIFGFIFVVLNCLGLFFEGGAMSSELLHMIGFGVGYPLALSCSFVAWSIAKAMTSFPTSKEKRGRNRRWERRRRRVERKAERLSQIQAPRLKQPPKLREGTSHVDLADR